MIGEVIDGRYKLDEEVGEGGMGVVYAATHVMIGKRVAMKVLRRDHASDHEAISRFMREAQLASAIKHPNVVDLSDFGQLPDGRVYYVMELLQGRSLADRIDHDGPMQPARALEVATQIAKGLAAAHKHGIVHRDLKPDNIYLVDLDEGAPVAKLFDFGIARAADSKLTRPGAVLGTPEYMSPEQATGVPVDARADLYALGVILMELLTCQVPFAAAALVELIRMQLSTPAPLLSAVEPGLAHLTRTEALIDRLLQKDPTLRPATAEEVIAALADARAETGREGRRPGKTTHAIGSGGDVELSTSPTMAWHGPRRTVGFRGGAWNRKTPIGTMPLAPPPGAAPAVGPKPSPATAAGSPRVTEPQSLVHKPPSPPAPSPAAPAAVRAAKSAPVPTSPSPRSTPPIVWVLGGAFVVALGAGGVLAVQALSRDDTSASSSESSASPPPASDAQSQTPAAVAKPSAPEPAAVVDDPPASPPTHEAPPAPTSDDLPEAPPTDFTSDSPNVTDATDAPPAESKAAPRTSKKPKPKTTTTAPAQPTTAPQQDPPAAKPPPRTAPPPKASGDDTSTKSGGHAFELRDPFGRK